jgi:TRAP-type C4-dicarboxylate transport system permease small subunit
MSDEPVLDEEGNPVGLVVKKAGRFSKEFLATVISLVSTAFGVVVALAWNTAIQKWFERIFRDTGGEVPALFLYAVVVTLIGVMVIVYLGRLAARIGAQPVEFKFPGTPKS